MPRSFQKGRRVRPYRVLQVFGGHPSQKMEMQLPSSAVPALSLAVDENTYSTDIRLGTAAPAPHWRGQVFHTGNIVGLRIQGFAPSPLVAKTSFGRRPARFAYPKERQNESAQLAPARVSWNGACVAG